MKAKYFITQIYIPFIYHLALNSNNEIVIFVNTNAELIIAQKIKKIRSRRTTILNIKRKDLQKKKVEKEINYLEKFKGLEIKFALNEVWVEKNKEYISESVLICWNSTEYIEQYFIKKLGLKAVIFELGYFRPNTLVIANNFHKHYPTTFLNYGECHTNTYGLKLDEIRNAWKSSQSDNAFVLQKTFMHFECLFNVLRPRKVFKNIFYNVLNKIVLLFYRLYDLIIKLNYSEFDLVFFDQVSDDSSILLDENFNKKEALILKLLSDCKKKKLKILYRPHPKGFNIENVILFQKNGARISMKNESLDVISKIPIVSTFNSTIGIETIQTDKPLIALGHSFYKNAGGVFSELGDISYNNDVKKMRDDFIQRLKSLHTYLEP